MKNLILIIFTLFLFISCDKVKKKDDEKPSVGRTIKVPDFNGDSAYYYTQKQVDFGPRVPNSKAHKLCGNYLAEKLEAQGAKVTVQEFQSQSFDGKNLSLKNIFGSFNPETPKRILLAAHWDTRPFADKDSVRKDKPIDGANDGASAVGAILEIARLIGMDTSSTIGLDVIFFDGEDYGELHGASISGEKVWWCLGSQYWSVNKHAPNYSAYFGVLLDMVGAKNAKFYKEEYSMQFAPSVVDLVWKTGVSLGYGNFFIDKMGGAITDDHYFVNTKANIPMIDIIEFDPESESSFGKYHHTHGDNMSIIDKNTLSAVGNTLLHVLYSEQM